MHKFSLKRELTPAVNSAEYCGGDGGCGIIMNNATERNAKLGLSFWREIRKLVIVKEKLRRTLGPETNDAAEAEEDDIAVGRRFFHD
jgi:hypothetical protein